MAIKVIHLQAEFEDKRGGITRVVDKDKYMFSVVLRITSKKGTIRSNHYHIKDSHYLYIESGLCEYFEKPVNDPDANVESVVLKPGDLVFTKPGIIHAVKFLEDTILFAFTTEKRQRDKYETDTKRVVIIK